MNKLLVLLAALSLASCDGLSKERIDAAYAKCESLGGVPSARIDPVNMRNDTIDVVRCQLTSPDGKTKYRFTVDSTSRINTLGDKPDGRK